MAQVTAKHRADKNDDGVNWPTVDEDKVTDPAKPKIKRAPKGGKKKP